jgi:hypothetical protein
MLKEAKPQKAHDKALQQIGRLAAKFSEDIKSLRFRPFVEDLDRLLSSKLYEQSYCVRIEKLSAAELKKEWIGVGKANRLLKKVAADVSLCWQGATGRSLPRLPAKILQRSGLGYRREFAALAASHPLWLIFDAVGLKVSASTVNQLVSENIEIADKLGLVSRPV